MKGYWIFVLFILTSICANAQNEYDDATPPSTEEEEFVGFNKKNKDKKDLSRIRIGGTAGFGFANNQLNFSISPTVGYQIVEDRLEVGTGIIYEYYRLKDVRNLYLQNTIGSSTYARIYVWQGIFAQARGVYQKSYRELNNTKLTPVKLGNIFGGAGYQFELSDKAFFNIGVEINIIPYDLSIVNTRAERVITPFFNFQFAL